MTVIPNWRAAPRMLSVQIATLAIAWGLLPVDMQAAMLAAIGVPAERVTAVLGLLMLVGRLVAQPNTQQQQQQP